MQRAEEARLLGRCRRGEKEAWDELFDLHYASAYRFIFQLGCRLTHEDTEEICQETFLSAIRNLHSFNARSAFQTWLFRIAANKARDFLERQSAAKRGGGQLTMSLDAEDPETGLKLDPVGPSPAPDEQITAGERLGLVQDAVSRLEEPCREIIQLRYFGDLSYEELATTLNLNPKTVSSRLSRCLDRLEEIVRHISTRENIELFPV